MHSFLIPKKLGLHRQAGIALYRALLLQSRRVPLSDKQRDALQNIVQNRFQANRHHVSRRKIKLAFHGGYTALDILDASAAGDEASTSRLADYLSRIPQGLSLPPRRRIPKAPDPAILDPPPEKKFLTVFPRRTVPGIRKVPSIVHASNKLPFVRYCKPQPKNLSRVLRQKLETYLKRQGQRHNLVSFYGPLAQYEDDWETLLSSYCNWAEHDDRTYTDGAKDEDMRLQTIMTQNNAKKAVLARKMQDIVDKEAELAEQERAERRRQARERRKTRKSAQHALSEIK